MEHRYSMITKSNTYTHTERATIFRCCEVLRVKRIAMSADQHCGNIKMKCRTIDYSITAAFVFSQVTQPKSTAEARMSDAAIQRWR